MAPSDWQAANSATLPEDFTKNFTIKVKPDTDIWRPNPTHDVFTAPHIYKTIAAKNFKSLAATVTADWKTLYDQGGIFLAFPQARADVPTKWIKAGIEYYQGRYALSVVGCDNFSDWSLCPLDDGETSASLEFLWDEKALNVFVHRKGQKQILREILWAFGNLEVGQPVRAGVYGAKPKEDEGNATAELEVKFSGLKLEIV